jgi:hypothetical protein
MPLPDDIRGLADQVLNRVDEAREFSLYSRQAWRLVQQASCEPTDDRLVGKGIPPTPDRYAEG